MRLDEDGQEIVSCPRCAVKEGEEYDSSFANMCYYCTEIVEEEIEERKGFEEMEDLCHDPDYDPDE